MKRVLSVVLAALLAVAPALAAIQPLKGFDKKVFDGALALYASSEMAERQDRFICSARTIEKVQGGYLVLSAGHCTPANNELPPDMTFSVADDVDGAAPKTPVKLLAAALTEDVKGVEDWSLFFYPTTRDYPVIPLGDENLARLNDPTIDVNFSLGLAKEISMGLVSSTVQKTGPMAGFFEVTQFDSHGASGSAVIDERTKTVIGIVIAGVDGSTVPTWVEPISVIRLGILKAKLALKLEQLSGGTGVPFFVRGSVGKVPMWTR